MMNSNEPTTPELPANASDPSSPPPPLPPEDDRKARDRWRRIGLRLGEAAETEVDKLRKSQEAEKKPSDVNPTIRAIAQVVLTSLRAMEMEDSYDRKLGSKGGDDDCAEQRRAAIKRNYALRRELRGQPAAGEELEGSPEKETEE